MTTEYDELLERLDAADDLIYTGKGVAGGVAVKLHADMKAAIRALTAQVVERDAVIKQAPHERQCLASKWNDWNKDRTCTCWKADYATAKEAIS